MVIPSANGDAPETVAHAKSLSDRGKNANIALLPMTYFAPIADMLKNLWYDLFTLARSVVDRLSLALSRIYLKAVFGEQHAQSDFSAFSSSLPAA